MLLNVACKNILYKNSFGNYSLFSYLTIFFLVILRNIMDFKLQNMRLGFISRVFHGSPWSKILSFPTENCISEVLVGRKSSSRLLCILVKLQCSSWLSLACTGAIAQGNNFFPGIPTWQLWSQQISLCLLVITANVFSNWTSHCSLTAWGTAYSLTSLVLMTCWRRWKSVLNNGKFSVPPIFNQLKCYHLSIKQKIPTNGILILLLAQQGSLSLTFHLEPGLWGMHITPSMISAGISKLDPHKAWWYPCIFLKKYTSELFSPNSTIDVLLLLVLRIVENTLCSSCF